MNTMKRLTGFRPVVTLIAVLISVGLFASMTESEGFDHQKEAHNCIQCCQTSHQSMMPESTEVLPKLVPSLCSLLDSILVHSQTASCPPGQPPEVLA